MTKWVISDTLRFSGKMQNVALLPPERCKKIPILHFYCASPNAKNIAIDFNGGMLTSDAGTLLLQQVELKIKIFQRMV
jgi:hypothetical protein